jgi:hypothetical protein
MRLGPEAAVTPRRRTPLRDVAYIWLRYWRRHGRPPHLFAPRRFTEKLQWRKLFDLDPRHTMLCDKFALRSFLAERGGADLLVPLLWIGESAQSIPFDRFAGPYVLKCTHGNAMNIFVDDPGAVDRPAVEAMLSRWLGRNHGRALVESGHIGVPPRIMAEAMLREADGRPPREFKVFVFGGKAALIAIRVNVDHFVHSVLHVLPDWTPTPLKLDTPLYEGALPARPAAFDRMMDVAEAVGADFDHVRVDFFECRGRLYFGEVSLYSQSGLVPFDPDSFDVWMGGLWALPAARRRALAALRGRALT